MRYKTVQEIDSIPTQTQFIEWASAQFSLPPEELGRFLKAMEVLHGYQPIAMNKTLFRVEYAKAVNQGRTMTRSEVLELSYKCNVTEPQMTNMCQRDKLRLTDTVTWEANCSDTKA